MSTENTNNESKLTTKQEWWNVLKFTLFSISAGIIQILSFTLLSELVFMDSNNKYGFEIKEREEK